MGIKIGSRKLEAAASKPSISNELFFVKEAMKLTVGFSGDGQPGGPTAGHGVGSTINGKVTVAL